MLEVAESVKVTLSTVVKSANTVDIDDSVVATDDTAKTEPGDMAIADATKAVEAICVLFVPDVAVGVRGVPVKLGEAIVAYAVAS
jgi:hypothetical protein